MMSSAKFTVIHFRCNPAFAVAWPTYLAFAVAAAGLATALATYGYTLLALYHILPCMCIALVDGLFDFPSVRRQTFWTWKHHTDDCMGCLCGAVYRCLLNILRKHVHVAAATVIAYGIVRCLSASTYCAHGSCCRQNGLL